MCVAVGCARRVVLRSSDNCYVPFRRPRKGSIRVSLNCNRRMRPTAKRGFFRRKVSFGIEYCVLSTITDNVISNINGSPMRNVYRAIHCNKCRIACNRLSGMFTRFKRQIGTKRAITLDNRLLRVRIGFGNRRLGPVRFLAVLCNGVGTLRRTSNGNTTSFCSTRAEMGGSCRGSRERVRRLVLHFLPLCVRSLRQKTCAIPTRARRSLHRVFAVKTTGRCFCRGVPDVCGPLKLKHGTVPLTYGMRGLLVTSFLGCLTLQRSICLSTANNRMGGGFVAGP